MNSYDNDYADPKELPDSAPGGEQCVVCGEPRLLICSECVKAQYADAPRTLPGEELAQACEQVADCGENIYADTRDKLRQAATALRNPQGSITWPPPPGLRRELVAAIECWNPDYDGPETLLDKLILLLGGFGSDR